jgi:hypothetical protein
MRLQKVVKRNLNATKEEKENYTEDIVFEIKASSWKGNNLSY